MKINNFNFINIIIIVIQLLFLFINGQTIQIKTLDQLLNIFSSSTPKKGLTVIIMNDIPSITPIVIPTGYDVTIKGQPSQNGRRNSALQEAAVWVDDGEEITRRVRLGGNPLQTGHVYIEVQAGAVLRLETLEIMTSLVTEEGVTNSGGRIEYIRGCNFYGPGNAVANWNGGIINSIETSYFVRSDAQATLSGIRPNLRNLGGSTINSITSCSFIGASNGGGVWNYGTIGSITQTSFNKNSDLLNAQIVDSQLQERFANLAATSSFQSAIFNGGTIGPISRCTFEGLMTKTTGGAIMNGDRANIGDISSSIFEACTAGDQGGAIYSLGTIASITQSIFTDNVANNNGGALLFTLAGTITKGITSNSFINNYAGSTGGAMNFRAGAKILGSISDCKFEANTGILYGGAISLDSGAAQLVGGISKCIFNKNDGARGGAIHIAYKALSGSIVDSQFTNNIATSFYGGGAIFMGTDASPAFTVERCTFSQNVGSNGGAIRVYQDGMIYQIVDCSFDSNTAELYGGAISNYGAISYITRCRFTKNIGSLAAAIYNDDARITTIEDCQIINNSGGGSALLNTVGVIDYVKGTLFANNGGRGITNQFYVRNIWNSVFSGDIIYNYGQNINSLSKCAFSDRKTCQNNADTKTLCPSCDGCTYNGAESICSAVDGKAYKSFACPLLSSSRGCNWSGAVCSADGNANPPPPPEQTNPPTVKTTTKSPTTLPPTSSPTSGSPVNCADINKIKSQAARASACRAATQCLFNTSKKCVDKTK